jgi:periplasmic protein TonB
MKEIKQPPKMIQVSKMAAPTTIPKKIEMVKEDAPTVDFSGGGGVAGGTGSADGALGGLLGSSGAAPPPPPKAPTRVRIGGNVEQASILRQTPPLYPAIAKTAHVQGTVVLHAIIGKDGSVTSLEYVSGPQLLMKAAMDAVGTWRYKPLMLNGEATEVETEISVVFTLNE